MGFEFVVVVVGVVVCWISPDNALTQKLFDGDNSLVNIELKWLVEELTRDNGRSCSELPLERRTGL